MKTAIIYGSTNGNTQNVAELIKKKIKDLGDVFISSVDSVNIPELVNYDLLFLGSSTWGFGDLQDDWQSAIGSIAKLDLNKSKVAIFGTGDQENFSSTFVDSIGLIAEKINKTGAKIIGEIDNTGYNFEDSKALDGDNFIGLPLDEDNQPDLTESRIDNWIEKIKKEVLV